MARRKSLAERLNFLGLSCFGVKIHNVDPDGENGAPVVTEMNLQEIMAAEDDQFWVIDVGSGQSPTRTESFLGSPPLVPLMRLIEVMDFEDEVDDITGVGSLGDDSVCCVCMVRKKRSELVPCKHTFCRGCARKLWFDRATCPLCFHWIKEFLDLGM